MVMLRSFSHSSTPFSARNVLCAYGQRVLVGQQHVQGQIWSLLSDVMPFCRAYIVHSPLCFPATRELHWVSRVGKCRVGGPGLSLLAAPRDLFGGSFDNDQPPLPMPGHMSRQQPPALHPPSDARSSPTSSLRGAHPTALMHAALHPPFDAHTALPASCCTHSKAEPRQFFYDRQGGRLISSVGCRWQKSETRPHN
eukprot:1160431-Pelagomonas_calceolata.AAC.2